MFRHKNKSSASIYHRLSNEVPRNYRKEDTSSVCRLRGPDLVCETNIHRCLTHVKYDSLVRSLSGTAFNLTASDLESLSNTSQKLCVS